MTGEITNELIGYYDQNLIESVFDGQGADHILIVKVKNDVDIQKISKGGELAWSDKGEYPVSFKAIITTENGKCTSSFQYIGAFEGIPQTEIDEYDALLDFQDFWKDDVAKKFNSEKQVEFNVQEGINIKRLSKLIFDYINESTRLGADITIILVDSVGERTNLLIPANK